MIQEGIDQDQSNQDGDDEEFDKLSVTRLHRWLRTLARIKYCRKLSDTS